MSLGGQNASPSVIVYGPDGTAYGSPADAAAAGVSNATMSQPIGVPDNQYVPMQVRTPQYYTPPAYQPYTPVAAPLPNIPTQPSGGRNRYAEIMANYQQAQPSMPPSYSGGFTGYPSDYTGGFTPYKPTVPTPAPIVDQPSSGGLLTGGGGGKYGASSDGEPGAGFIAPTSQNAYDVSQLGKNISYVSPLVGSLTGMYGNYLASQVDPNYSNEGRNYPAPTGGFVSTPDTQAVRDAINSTDFSGMDRGSGDRGGDSDGGGRATGGNNGDASGGGDRGTRGGFAQGGYVSMQNLGGLDPMGPDDGYATLKDGEFVINDKAVKKYGIELMNAINSGKISKGKLRGLLEM